MFPVMVSSQIVRFAVCCNYYNNALRLCLPAGFLFKDNHDQLKSNRPFTFGKTSLSL